MITICQVAAVLCRGARRLGCNSLWVSAKTTTPLLHPMDIIFDAANKIRTRSPGNGLSTDVLEPDYNNHGTESMSPSGSSTRGNTKPTSTTPSPLGTGSKLWVMIRGVIMRGVWSLRPSCGMISGKLSCRWGQDGHIWRKDWLGGQKLAHIRHPTYSTFVMYFSNMRAT